MSQRSANNPRTQKTMKGEATGTAKKSAARAKPATQAAGTVRHVSSTKAPATKEEQRQRRDAERAADDDLSVVTQYLSKQDAEYTKRRRVWWVLIIAGLAFTVISAILMYAFPTTSGDTATPTGAISLACLVIAYIGIIGALIYDLVRVRPLRNKAEEKARSLTPKKRQEIIDAEARAEAERRAAKKAKKGGSAEGEPAESATDGDAAAKDDRK